MKIRLNDSWDRFAKWVVILGIVLLALMMADLKVNAKELTDYDKAIQEINHGINLVSTACNNIAIRAEEDRMKSNDIIVTDEERLLLYMITSAEARGESHLGKMRVVQTILNRVESDSFPNDIRSVIYQKDQFEPVATGAIHSAPILEAVILAVEEVLANDGINDYDGLYFNHKSLVNGWVANNKEYIDTIDNHSFYR